MRWSKLVLSRLAPGAGRASARASTPVSKTGLLFSAGSAKLVIARPRDPPALPVVLGPPFEAALGVSRVWVIQLRRTYPRHHAGERSPCPVSASRSRVCERCPRATSRCRHGVEPSRVGDIATISARDFGFDVAGAESMPRRRIPRPNPLGEETLSNDYKAIFAHNLRVARARTGMSQSELASKFNVKRAYIVQVESGSENLTLDTMRKFSEILGIDLLDMLRKDFERG